MNGVLIFDGNCGMCTRVRTAYLGLTAQDACAPSRCKGRVCLNASGLTQSGYPSRCGGLIRRELSSPGLKAMNAAVSTALGTTLPLTVYRIPLVGRLQEVDYRWVAAHRYRFRGVTPLCEPIPGSAQRGPPEDNQVRQELIHSQIFTFDISADPQDWQRYMEVEINSTSREIIGGLRVEYIKTDKS
jgi:predicted DCC family thiol-disulfide oxidoreductase YuxK